MTSQSGAFRNAKWPVTPPGNKLFPTKMLTAAFILMFGENHSDGYYCGHLEDYRFAIDVEDNDNDRARLSALLKAFKMPEIAADVVKVRNFESAHHGKGPWHCLRYPSDWFDDYKKE